MYVPAHFVESQVEVLHRTISAYPLGMLVTHTEAGLDANHIPFELDATRGPFGTLTAHVARANPVWESMRDGAEVLVVFRGAEGYISPNWYPSKHETHRHVPTWNYEVVHAHGRPRILDDEKSVRAIVGKLTRRHEAGEPRPWRMGDAPADYMAEMLTQIVGIEIDVHRLVGKRKLSQNREPRDRDGVVDALRQRSLQGLASAVEIAGRSLARPPERP